VTAIHRFPDYRSELAAQQPENVLELAFSPSPFEFAIGLRHILHFHFVRIRRLILSRIRAVGVSATCPCRIVTEISNR